MVEGGVVGDTEVRKWRYRVKLREKIQESFRKDKSSSLTEKSALLRELILLS